MDTFYLVFMILSLVFGVKCSSQFYNNDDNSGGTDAKINFLFDNFNANNNNNYKSMSSMGSTDFAQRAGNNLTSRYSKRWKWLNPLVVRQSRLISDHAHRRTRKMMNFMNGNGLITTKKSAAIPQFMPSISVGSLNDMPNFLTELKSNLKKIENEDLSPEQMKLLDVDPEMSRKDYIADSILKPQGSAAFIHAIRNYRPSSSIRQLVSMEPKFYRGTNFYTPNYKWMGLG